MQHENTINDSQGAKLDNGPSAEHGEEVAKGLLAKSVNQCTSEGEPVNGATAATQAVGTLQTMQAQRRWLLWRSEQGKEGKKPKKVPYYTNGAARGKLDSPEDWALLASYNDACDAFNKGGYSGLGFALGPDEGGGYWQGVDLDDILEHGNQLFANEIPGYVELSPSEEGIHAIGFGRDFNTLGSNGTGVEAYSKGRFFTFTGRLIRDSSLTCLAGYVENKLEFTHSGSRLSKSPDQPDQPDLRSLPPQTVTELRSALHSMSADEYALWINIGQALSSISGGRGLWMDWSATSEKFDSAEAAKKWRTFKATEIDYKTVFYTAQRLGWVNPRSNAAQLEPAMHSASVYVDVEEPCIVPMEYLNDPYIPKGHAIGVYGRGESGKSSFVATLAAEGSTSYSTLWITSEESKDNIKIRHKRIAKDKDTTIAVVGGGAGYG